MWNAPFKSRIKAQYEDWILHGDRPLTRGGNPAPPPMEVYLQWIVNAWNDISNELIERSFKVCGITNNPDGSEDHLIHSFKTDGPIPNGLVNLEFARLENELGALEVQNDLVDLEQDEENGIMSDCSIEF